jgi:two-component system, chemotaxis family, chemotaxis protein CheY
MKYCLVVDNSSVVRTVCRSILESCGWEVGEATTGEEALTACSARMPDALFLDWQLTGVSANDLVMAIRSSTSGQRPFIFYCTTENDPVDISRMLAIGANDFILKPFDYAELKERFGPLQTVAA